MRKVRHSRGIEGMLILMLMLTAGRLTAQLPACLPDNSGGLIYFVNSGQIHNWNPALPFSGTNPSVNTIALPPSTFNLAVSSNLNNPAGPSPTFYVATGSNVTNATYRYYNGTTWVNTGHIAGSVNPGGGAGAIYGYVNDNNLGTIRKYDGTGNATNLITIPDLNEGGPADVQGEAGTDNFYILRVNAPGWLRKYDGNGNLLYQWNVTYGGATGGGSGFAIMNGTLYAKTNDGLYSGVINPAGIDLMLVAGTPASIITSNDMAACFPGIPTPPLTSSDTVYLCSSPSTTVTSSGTGTYSYTILSGSPAITGNGPDYSVTTPTLSTVVIHSNNTASGAVSHDTFTIVPPPMVNAGMDDTLRGCGTFPGMLHATVTNMQPWITYTYNWTPAAFITTGANTLTPGINPSADTTYTLSVSTGNEHGNCVISDSVRIRVEDESVTADFSFDLRRNCVADSVFFTDSSRNATQYIWDFGDGNNAYISDPLHVYSNRGIYNVKLKADNGMCRDSVVKIIDNTHALTAAFTTDADTICEGGTVVFTNASVMQHGPGIYNWSFGDGSVSADTNPSYTFPGAGSYMVKLIVSDVIPCYDTIVRTIVVDSIPKTKLLKSTGNTCIGIPVYFDASVAAGGLRSLSWNFGDGIVIPDASNLTHAYDEPGTYQVHLNAQYRACPEANLNDSVIVHPLPLANIGPDTTICLDGDPVFLTNTAPMGAAYRYLWNTGDTTPVYRVVHPGTYTLTVTNEYGCNASDDVTVTKDCYIDIPNAFTPNSDGVDDAFFPRQLLSAGLTGFTMQVFNRWGQVVFQTNTVNGRGWDGTFNGKHQPQGVYIYMIEVALKNGRTEKYTGNVTLLR